MKTILFVLLAAFVCSKLTPELAEKYSLEIIEEAETELLPKRGSKVSVHYTGTLLNGNKFDSSKDRGTPFDFNVGNSQVIKCWDEVVAHLSVGDHVKVTCPYATAYGDRGVGPIPAKSDLIFEIEMLKIHA